MHVSGKARAALNGITREPEHGCFAATAIWEPYRGMYHELSPTPARDSDPERLERGVGLRVRGYRTQLNRTVSDVARAAGLSPGMLSKIENGATSPSLATVSALARALNVSVSALFDGLEDRCAAVSIPAERILAPARNGSDIRLLGHIAARGVTLEPVVVTLTHADGTPVLPTDRGAAFVQVLAGEVIYRHGEDSYHLRETDGLAVDAEVAHAPEEVVRAPVRLLLVQARARV